MLLAMHGSHGEPLLTHGDQLYQPAMMKATTMATTYQPWLPSRDSFNGVPGHAALGLPNGQGLQLRHWFLSFSADESHGYHDSAIEP